MATATKTQEQTKQLKIVNMLVTCPKLGKNVTVSFSDIEFSSWLSDCDCCGGHGSVDMSFKCKCGQTHDIELNSW